METKNKRSIRNISFYSNMCVIYLFSHLIGYGKFGLYATLKLVLLQ